MAEPTIKAKLVLDTSAMNNLATASGTRSQGSGINIGSAMGKVMKPVVGLLESILRGSRATGAVMLRLVKPVMGLLLTKLLGGTLFAGLLKGLQALFAGLGFKQLGELFKRGLTIGAEGLGKVFSTFSNAAKTLGAALARFAGTALGWAKEALLAANIFGRQVIKWLTGSAIFQALAGWGARIGASIAAWLLGGTLAATLATIIGSALLVAVGAFGFAALFTKWWVDAVKAGGKEMEVMAEATKKLFDVFSLGGDASKSMEGGIRGLMGSIAMLTNRIMGLDATFNAGNELQRRANELADVRDRPATPATPPVIPGGPSFFTPGLDINEDYLRTLGNIQDATEENEQQQNNMANVWGSVASAAAAANGTLAGYTDGQSLNTAITGEQNLAHAFLNDNYLMENNTLTTLIPQKLSESEARSANAKAIMEEADAIRALAKAKERAREAGSSSFSRSGFDRNVNRSNAQRIVGRVESQAPGEAQGAINSFLSNLNATGNPSTMQQVMEAFQ